MPDPQHAYTTRPARPSDLDTVQTIEMAAMALFDGLGLVEPFGTDPLPRPLLEEGVAANRLWVAVTPDDAPVGFSLATVVDGAGHLKELNVTPEHGRRGLGRRLVDTVLAWASGEGYAAVTLTTFRDVPWNAPFYARMGFQELEGDALSPELRRVFLAEAAGGELVDQRVVMRRNLA